jgi:hypothetical protein
MSRAVGIEAMDGRSHRGLVEIDVRLRAHRQIELRTVAIERKRPRVVARPHAGKGNDLCPGTGDAHRCGVIAVAFHRRRFGDVQPALIHRQAVGAIEFLDNRRLRPVLHDVNGAVRHVVRDEEFATRAEQHESRAGEVAQVLLDDEARGHLELRTLWTRHDRGIVTRRFGGERLR